MSRAWVRTQHPPDAEPSEVSETEDEKGTRREGSFPERQERALSPTYPGSLSWSRCETQLWHPLPTLEKWVTCISKWTVLQTHCPSAPSVRGRRTGQELTGISLLGFPCRQCAPHNPAGTHTTKIPGEMSLSPHLFWCVPRQHEVPSGIAMVLPSAKSHLCADTWI